MYDEIFKNGLGLDLGQRGFSASEQYMNQVLQVVSEMMKHNEVNISIEHSGGDGAKVNFQSRPLAPGRNQNCGYIAENVCDFETIKYIYKLMYALDTKLRPKIRKILLLENIRFAYKHILHFSDEECRKWMDAFYNEEIESVMFHVITKQNGIREKLIEFNLTVDWEAYEKHALYTPGEFLKIVLSQETGVTFDVTEAVAKYLGAFQLARTRFPDCVSEFHYSCSKKSYEDSPVQRQIRQKLGYGPFYLLRTHPYRGTIRRHIYSPVELPELKAEVKTYFY